MRIAFFGGTFDPPHRGHVAIARAAAEAFALDRVLFAPTGVQPLKVGNEATAYADRLALVEAACGEDARFEASEVDAPRPDGGPNYTVETLGRLVALYPGDRLFALVGADAFLGLRQWREPDRLLELVEWIVVSRPGYPLGGGDGAGLAGLGLNAAQRARVHLLAGVDEEVSATELRERLRRGEGCGELVPEAVAGRIAAGGLYR